MATKAQVPQNKFLRIVTIPVRALVKAKDFYVRSMINCSSGVGYGGTGGMGGVHAKPLPRSFSSASSSMSNESEDYIELVRAASGKGSLGNKLDLELYLQQQMMMKNNSSRGVAGSRKMPRSASVAMGKIEEDKPYIFGEDVVEVDIKTQMKYPRSRSYAPTSELRVNRFANNTTSTSELRVNRFANNTTPTSELGVSRFANNTAPTERNGVFGS